MGINSGFKGLILFLIFALSDKRYITIRERNKKNASRIRVSHNVAVEEQSLMSI